MQQIAPKFDADLRRDDDSVIGEVEAPYPTSMSLMREMIADGIGMAAAILDAQQRQLERKAGAPPQGSECATNGGTHYRGHRHAQASRERSIGLAHHWQKCTLAVETVRRRGSDLPKRSPQSITRSCTRRGRPCESRCS